MAETDVLDPAAPPDATPDAGPSPGLAKYLDQLGLSAPVDTSRSDALLQESLQIGRERRADQREILGRRRDELATDERLLGQQGAARAAAAPGPLQLPEVPQPQPRPFAEARPDAPLLTQLNTVMLGVGQMAMQFAGLKGNNRLALAALTGALQGWQAGDAERANRELKVWQQQTQKVLDEHKDKVERARDLLTDHQLTWSQRASLTGLRAKADEWQDMIAASQQGDIELMLKAQQRAEDLQQKRRDEFAKATAQIDQRQQKLDEDRRKHDLDEKRYELDRIEKAHERELDRDLKKDLAGRADQLRRDIAAQSDATRRELAEQSNAIRRDGLALREQLGSDKKAEKQKGYQTMGRVLSDMDAMVDDLNKANMLPKEDGKLSEWSAGARRWSKPNEDTWRQWLALQGAMVGYERQIYDDKGARALSVYKSLLDFVDRPPTAATAHKVIERMRSYLGGATSEPAGGDGWKILTPAGGR